MELPNNEWSIPYAFLEMSFTDVAKNNFPIYRDEDNNKGVTPQNLNPNNFTLRRWALNVLLNLLKCYLFY